MASRRIDNAVWRPRGRIGGREGELRRLGSHESALVREVRRHLRARPLEYDERGVPMDRSSLATPERPRRLATD